MPRTLTTAVERWPLARPFATSRGTKTEAVVVVVTIADGDAVGRAECVPYPRYGETVEGVVEAIASIDPNTTREALQAALAAGAARNAVDCALWDLEAQMRGTTVAAVAGLDEPVACITACTVELGDPEAMATAASRLVGMPLLKLKLAGDGGDLARVKAVRAVAPEADLIVDPNEGWTAAIFEELSAPLATLGVRMIEQPLPASADEALATLPHPVPVCADESVHTRGDLTRVADRYELINVKLDKTGGLTEALSLIAAAREHRLGLMVGCMCSTSLSIAPALLLAQGADFVDLDAGWLLARDREGGLHYDGGRVGPPRAV